MCPTINQALPPKSDFKPIIKNLTEKIDKPVIVINIKDEKKLNPASLKMAKSQQFDFVEEPKTTSELTSHKIISTTSKIISEEIGKKVSEKTVIKAIAKTSGETFTKSLLKSVGKNTAETAAASVAEELTIKTLEKSALKASKEGSSLLAKKLSGAVPVIGTAMEIGFTIWDASYAYDLSKNKNVSKVSKVLAWATVGLDVVSAVTVATGVGSPIGWAATGLSVGTAVLSDILK
jgi:hypothetical protein